jgi:hypothetical protein
MRTLARISAILLGFAAACGNSSGGSRSGASDDAGSATPAERPHVPKAVAIGRPSLTGFAYSRGPGRKPFRDAIAAEKQQDFAGAEKHSRAALAADPGHLEARWLLGKALAAQKRYAAVGDELAVAVAGDWLRWGPRVLEDADLAAFRDSVHGPPLISLVEEYRDQMREIARDGVWVVGRRGKAWLPNKTAATSVNHRSEIYVYHPDRKAFVRASRTNGSLVAMIPSPAANEAAYVSYRQVWLPTDEQRGQGQVPYFRHIRVGTIDADGPRMSRKEAVFDDVWALEVFYATELDGRHGAGVSVSSPALIVRSWPVRKGNRRSSRVATHLIDPETGGTTSIGDVPNKWDALGVSYGSASMRRARVDGVAADWDAEGTAGAFMLENTQRAVTLPDGESASRHAMRWSTRQTRLVFATQPVDACGDDRADRESVLYVVEAATGKLQAIARGSHDFAPVWLDDARLAYVAWPGADAGVHVYDAEAGVERYALETPGGLGTQWLPARTLCGAPVIATSPGDTDDGFDDEWDDDDGIPDAPEKPAP